jgi:MraZ protein
MFLGEFEHSVDDKGRLAVPAKFRAELSGGLVVTRGLDRCLFIWPMEEWRAIAQKLGQLSLMNADARRIHRLIFSGATDTIPDRLGRILLPAYLREYAELQDQVVVVGLMNRMEIWNRDHWAAERSLAEQDSAQLAEHLFNLNLGL